MWQAPLPHGPEATTVAAMRKSEYQRLEREAMSSKDPVRQIEVITEIQSYWHDRLVASMKRARKQGISWARLADAIGVTKQAVLQRFGPGSRYDVEKDLRSREQPR